MRKNAILLACFALFVAFVLWIRVTLTRDADWVVGKAAEIRQTLGSPAATELYQELDSHWNRRIIWWGTVLPHEELHKASEQIKQLGVAVEYKNGENAARAERELQLTLSSLVERNTLRWDHIF